MNKKLTQENANKVLAMMVSNHFTDEVCTVKKGVKEVTFDRNGTECVVLDNGQSYTFSVVLNNK